VTETLAGLRDSRASARPPRFFLSHGTSDQILPIDQCNRVIVPRLKSMGYDVRYREFEGRHQVPPDIAAEGLRWVASL
jgi:phospholipase/carboxylesterase